jgi:hypothetical protein
MAGWFIKSSKVKKRDFGSDCPAPGGVPGLAVTGEIALKKAGANRGMKGACGQPVNRLKAHSKNKGSELPDGYMAKICKTCMS